MASNLGTVYVELSLDDKVYKQKLSETLTTAQATARGIETSWKALGSKSEAVYDAQRKAAENAYTLIKSHASSTANDIVRAEEAKNAKIKALNEQQFGHQTSLIESMKKNWMAVSAVAIGAYMLIQRAYSFSKEIASTTNEIDKNSKIIGMSTDEYQKWTYAAKMADVNSEELTKGFRLLSRNMSETAQGTGKAKDAFTAMGISVVQVGGGLKPLDIMMKEIMNKFAGWADGPQKIALSLALFGKSGETLIPLLNKGAIGFEEFARAAAKLGIILDPKFIEAGSRAEDTFKKISAQLEAGKLRLTPFAEGFASLIESMLGKLNEFRSWIGSNPKIWGFITGAIIPAPVNIAVGLLTAKGGKSELEKAQDEYLLLEEYYKRIAKPPAPAPVDPKLALESQQILLQQKMTLATMTRDIETQVKLTIDLATNEKARLAESKKLTPELSKQLDLTTSKKVVEIRRKEQEYQLGISNILVKMQGEYATITGDLEQQSAILDKELVNKLQQLALDVQAHKLTRVQADAQGEMAIALRDQGRLREADMGALSIHQKAIYEESLKYLGSITHINLEYGHMTGNLEQIEKAEQDSLDHQILINSYTAEEYTKLQQTLDVKQRIRQIETTATQQATVLNLGKQYLELLSQRSDNVKDLIANNKELEDAEVKRLTDLQASMPALADFYQKQIDWIKKIGQETRTQMEMDPKIFKDKADFYSQIKGYEDEYRKAQFAWIDKEEKRRAEFYKDDVAAAKWAHDEKIKFDAKVATDNLDNIAEGMKSSADAFESLSLLYAEDSSQRRTLHGISMAFLVAEKAALTVKAITEAVVAIAHQASAGDVYTAFARVAAMAATMVSLLSNIGASISGGGGSSRTYSPGGTALGANTSVLGGTAGQASESAKKSLELLEDTYTMEYRELTNIYDEMKSLNRNITGLVSSIVRGGGIGGAESYGVNVGLTQSWAQKVGENWMTSTKLATIGFVFGGLIGAVIGYVVGWLWKGIFGGGKEITVGGTGIALGAASVGGLLGGAGMTAQQYAAIKEKKEGGWFSGTSRKYYTLYQALDEDVTRLLTKVFVDLGATLVELSIALGTDTQATLNYVFPGGKINLAGLDAEGIDKAISQFISGAADDAIDALFGQMLRSYQQVGEGLLETAVRLVIDKEIILDTLKMTGQAFVGTTSEIIAFSEAIIEMAGDLKTLREAAETYYDKFFDDAEKQMRLQDQLTRVLLDMNILLPSTREGYRALVEGLDLTTEAGQRTYVSLLTLAEGADAYYKFLEEAAEQDLRNAFEAERKRITDAYQVELKGMNESLKNTQTIISDLQKSVDKLHSAKESMKLIDDASIKANYLAAKIQLMMVLQQARGGNLSGIAGLDKTLEILTGMGTGIYATAVDYKRDFYHTYSTIAELEELTGNQLSIEEQALALQQKQIDLLTTNYQAELAAMDSQLNALLGINTSVLSIVDAINALGIAQAAVTTATTTAATTTPDAIERLYQLVFNRLPDVGGKAFYEAQLAGGKDISRIAAELYGSPEYAAIKAVRGYASGGFHPGGLRLVGEAGPELEYTGPSNIIPFRKKSSDSELISEVRQLREEMRRGNFVIAKNTGKTAKIHDRWDIDGTPGVRTI